MLERCRPFFSALLRPLACIMRGLRISPNAVTIAGVALFLAAAFFTATGRWHAAAALAIAGSCLDGLDGLLAKMTGRASTFGAILDSSCDRITEIAWFGGMLAYYWMHPGAGHAEFFGAFLALGGSIMVSYVKARAEGAAVACSGGIFQRPERLITICACLLLGPRVMLWGLWLIAALSWITVAQRFVIAWNRAQAKDRDNGLK